MPLYEYRCDQCGRLTEKIQKFSDPELTVCPHCQGVLTRTLTAPAVHFSGGGWYKDLYSSARPPAANAGENAGASGEGAGAKAGEGSTTPAANSGSSSDSNSGTNSGSGSASNSATPAPAAAPASAPAASK